MIIGTTQTETPFLHEADLPECARLNRKRTLTQAEGNSGGAGTSLQDEEDRQLAEALAKSQAESIGK